MNVYVTPEQYDIAAKRGIRATCVNQRVRRYGWDVQRAISTPARRPSPWLAVARANGVHTGTFWDRVYMLGWPVARAATTRPGEPKHLSWADLAAENGIGAKTFYDRVIKHGWRASTAALTPKRGDAK